MSITREVRRAIRNLEGEVIEDLRPDHIHVIVGENADDDEHLAAVRRLGRHRGLVNSIVRRGWNIDLIAMMLADSDEDISGSLHNVLDFTDALNEIVQDSGLSQPQVAYIIGTAPEPIDSTIARLHEHRAAISALIPVIPADELTNMIASEEGNTPAILGDIGRSSAAIVRLVQNHVLSAQNVRDIVEELGAFYAIEALGDNARGITRLIGDRDNQLTGNRFARFLADVPVSSEHSNDLIRGLVTRGREFRHLEEDSPLNISQVLRILSSVEAGDYNENAILEALDELDEHRGEIRHLTMNHRLTSPHFISLLNEVDSVGDTISHLYGFRDVLQEIIEGGNGTRDEGQRSNRLVSRLVNNGVNTERRVLSTLTDVNEERVEFHGEHSRNHNHRGRSYSDYSFGR